MRVTIVRHHREDDPGFIGAAFGARGDDVSVRLFPANGPLPDPNGSDHIVVLGSASSVNDDGPATEWIGAELDWLLRADQAGVPMLGICFGAQALCVALGGRVEAAPSREIGWVLVDSLDTGLIPAGPWLEFHGDRCLPPPGAKVLASNRAGVQAFTVGRNLAVQFHPEVDAAQLAAWLAAGGRAEAERAGQDPDKLLAETAEREPAARQRAARLVEAAILIAGDRPLGA